MKDEIKEILDDLRKYANEGGEHKLMEYEIKHIQCYITNLQEELKSANESITWWSNRFKAVEGDNERLNKIIDVERESYDVQETIINMQKSELLKLEDYKSRNEKAKSLTNRTIEIIKQQPSGNDEWILERLNGINYCLGGDEE